MTVRLFHRTDLFYASPLPGEFSSAEEAAAFRARLLAAPSYASLSDEDRTLLQRAAIVVSAGHSEVVFDDYGDYAAIDAGLDADDDDVSLELALDAVGSGAYGHGEPPLSDSVDDDVPTEPDDGEDKALLGADDDGWVGL